MLVCEKQLEKGHEELLMIHAVNLDFFKLMIDLEFAIIYIIRFFVLTRKWVFLYVEFQTLQGHAKLQNLRYHLDLAYKRYKYALMIPYALCRPVTSEGSEFLEEIRDL